MVSPGAGLPPRLDGPDDTAGGGAADRGPAGAAEDGAAEDGNPAGAAVRVPNQGRGPIVTAAVSAMTAAAHSASNDDKRRRHGNVGSDIDHRT